MKTFHSLAIGTLMAVSLAACSSTPMNNSSDMSGSSATSGTTATGMAGASGTVGTTGDGNAAGKSPGLSNNATAPTDVR